MKELNIDDTVYFIDRDLNVHKLTIKEKIRTETKYSKHPEVTFSYIANKSGCLKIGFEDAGNIYRTCSGVPVFATKEEVLDYFDKKICRLFNQQ